jgi:hypothetical protein
VEELVIAYSLLGLVFLAIIKLDFLAFFLFFVQILKVTFLGNSSVVMIFNEICFLFYVQLE